MALDTYIRDKSYFRSLRDQGAYIESYNIDAEYTKIIDYLNNNIVPAVNAILNTPVGGIIDSANYYLRNVGDGTTQWSPLEQMINNYSLSFSKLIKRPVGSLLVSDGYGAITSVNPNNIADLILVSVGNTTPQWQKLKTENIEDGEITAVDIMDGAIKAEHLRENIAITNITNNYIIGNMLAGYVVNKENFVNGSITVNKLGIMPDLDVIGTQGDNVGNPGLIKRQHIRNGTLKPEKFADNIITSILFNTIQCIKPGKLIPNLINDNFLYPYRYEESQISSYIPGTKLGNLRLDSKKLSYGRTDSSCFTQEVQAAFARFGCVGP